MSLHGSSRETPSIIYSYDDLHQFGIEDTNIDGQHHDRVDFLQNAERQNVPFRAREDEDTNGELALRYLVSRKKDRENARQTERFSGGVEVLPTGLLHALLDRGYNCDSIRKVVEEFFDKTGLFPDSKRILIMLQAENRDRIYTINLTI